MNNIWQENLDREKQISESHEGRSMKIFEKVRWVNPDDNRKQACVHCGYYFEGKSLPESQRLLYLIKSKVFQVVEKDEVRLLNPSVMIEDVSLINSIIKTVSSVPVRGKFTREDTRSPYTDYCDTSKSLSEQLESLLRNLTQVQNDKVIVPIAISALMVPSALCNNFPITVFWGKSGTGKSSSLSLASGMYKCPPVSVFTYASIRNFIKDYRYTTDTDGEESEENIVVCMDDCNSDTFKDPKLYKLLKTGVSYSTGNQILSSTDLGTNLNFNASCPKLISTCDPFWQKVEYHELLRRIIIIPTEKSDSSFISKESIVYNSDFFSLAEQVKKFWLEKQIAFKSLCKKFNSDPSFKPFEEGEQEVVATMAILYDIDVSEAAQRYKEYRKAVSFLVKTTDPQHSYVDEFLRKAEAENCLLNAKRRNDGEPLIEFVMFSTADIKKEFKEGCEKGVFDRVNVQKISEVMREKGYSMKNLSGTWYWIKPMEYTEN